MNQTESVLDEAAPPTGKNLDSSETTRGRVTRRLDEYLLEELENPDPLQAALAVHTAQNLEMAYILGSELMNAANETGSLADVVANDPKALQAMLQLQRQADRNVNLSAACQRSRDASGK